jgi:hypothetical protein
VSREQISDRCLRLWHTPKFGGLDFYWLEVGFGHAAIRARPSFWHVRPAGARRNAVFRATGGFVVNKAANNAKVCLHRNPYKNSAVGSDELWADSYKK